MAIATAEIRGSASTSSRLPDALDGRVLAEHAPGPRDVEIAEREQPEFRRRLEVADKIGAPVTGSDDRDADGFTLVERVVR